MSVRQHVRHWLVLVSLSLVLGALTTLGICWWIGAATKLTSGALRIFPAESVLRTDDDAYLVMHTTVGKSDVVALMHGFTNLPQPPGYDEPLPTIGLDQLPSWVYAPGDEMPVGAPAGITPANQISYAMGWPLPAMRGFVVEYPQQGSYFWGSIDFWLVGRLGEQFRGFPLAVIPMGFVTNMFIYGVLWSGVLCTLPRTMIAVLRRVLPRRRRRRRKGCCPECGYDLLRRLDDGCSECGWGRQSEQGAV